MNEQIEDLVGEVERAQLPAPSERRRIRRAAKITAEEAAQVLGVARATIFAWEAGAFEPRRTNALVYREFLDRLRRVVEDDAA